MKRVAEIIHIVPSDRQSFLDGAINLDEETKKVLWACGVRKQQYFELGELLFMTFEYDGADFKADMNKMSAYLASRGHLVEKRRKDVPIEERETTNWWAPVKRIATLLDSKPQGAMDNTSIWNYMEMVDGFMPSGQSNYDTSYDEDDWTEGMHI